MFVKQSDGSYIEAGSIAGCLGKGHDGWCAQGQAPVTEVTVSPTKAKPGEKITISAKIKGVGPWVCGNFTLRFYFGTTYIGCYADRISSGQTWWVKFSYIIPEGTSPGNYTIKAKEALTGYVRSTTFTIVAEGKASVYNIKAPSEFTPDVSFVITVIARNVGGDDNLFIKLSNRDTGKILRDITTTTPISKGGTWSVPTSVKLTQTTDFHGRVEVGHIT